MKSGSLFVAGIISMFTAIFVLLAAFVYFAWKRDRARGPDSSKPAVHQRP